MSYEYCILTANVPLRGSVAAAVLLRTIADDRLHGIVREDLGTVLDPDGAEIVRGTVDMFIEQADREGGAAILDQLEDTLSNFLTLSPRVETVGTADVATFLARLAAEQFSCRCC
jgi:hypothetical protein